MLLLVDGWGYRSNLIAADIYNEAGRYYMDEKGLDAESVYDYVHIFSRKNMGDNTQMSYI